jgi:DNA polymerase III epsilon subunit-like protein
MRKMTSLFRLQSESGDLLVTGLDCETSGSDLAAGHRLIQVGLAVLADGEPRIFTSLVGWPENSWDEQSWSPQAQAVHNISREQLADALPADEVDFLAESWLLGHGALLGRRLVLSVGFNVGSFDHPFFARYLPRTRALITHRHVDLNSICFTMDGWSGRNWQQWKDAAKTAAAAQLRHLGSASHDAGYDAAEAVLAWQWIREQVNKAESN